MLKRYIVKRYENPNAEPFYAFNGGSSTAVITFNAVNSDATNVEYSTDRVVWLPATQSGNNITVTVNVNERTYIRASATHWARNGSNNTVVSINGNNIEFGGNILSLLYGANFTGNETEFPSLSATGIFHRFCTGQGGLVSLQNLKLPAMTMTEECYADFCSTCQNLVYSFKALPATTLAVHCYTGIFYYDSRLITTPTLVQNEYIPTEAYQSLFEGCASLTTAPFIPSFDFSGSGNYCLRNMFRSSNLLTAITVGDIRNWDTTKANNWLSGVSSTGTFTKPSGTTIPVGTSGIPANWTVINQ